MKNINQTLSELKTNNSKGFIPFIVGGHKGIESTLDFLIKLSDAGASVIELGVPFSDPVADGKAIQVASEDALSRGTTLGDVLECVKKFKKIKDTPILIFTYLNPIYKMGFETFSKKAKEAGVSGLLLVDLKPEDAAPINTLLANNSIETVYLSSPTTTPDRLELINNSSTGFVYYISRKGVTGVQSDVASDLEAQVKKIKTQITTPLAIGFGISNAEQALEVSKYADAVVIGSAIVNLIQDAKDPEIAANEVYEFSKTVKDTINKES